MHWSSGAWRALVVGLMPIALAIAGCGNVVSASNDAAIKVPVHGETAGAQVAAPSTRSDGYRIVNVEITDDGYQPSSVYLPVAQGVLLVVRNRGTTEHHYRIVGLVPQELEWLVGLADMQPAAGAPVDDHDMHHPSGFVTFRGPSPHGVQPLGNEVHAYAAAGAADAVLFVPTNTGTFRVQDPLHPEISGKVVVY